MTPRISLALAALLALAACGEQPPDGTAAATADSAAPDGTGFAGDIDAATREAVADTDAAAREAGVALDGAAAPVAPAEEAAQAATADAQP